MLPLFSFPDDARWNEETDAVEFGVAVGTYAGIVRVPRTVFRRLLGQPVSPENCLEHYHLNRTAFERAVEEKIRRRELTDDGNVALSGRDLPRSNG